MAALRLGGWSPAFSVRSESMDIIGKRVVHLPLSGWREYSIAGLGDF